MEDCETGILAKTQTQNQRREIRSYRAIALTSVMSKWYASCVMMRMEKGESARDLEQTSHGKSQQQRLSTSTGVGHIIFYKGTGNGKRKDLPC